MIPSDIKPVYYTTRAFSLSPFHSSTGKISASRYVQTLLFISFYTLFSLYVHIQYGLYDIETDIYFLIVYHGLNTAHCVATVLSLIIALIKKQLMISILTKLSSLHVSNGILKRTNHLKNTETFQKKLLYLLLFLSCVQVVITLSYKSKKGLLVYRLAVQIVLCLVLIQMIAIADIIKRLFSYLNLTLVNLQTSPNSINLIRTLDSIASLHATLRQLVQKTSNYFCFQFSSCIILIVMIIIGFFHNRTDLRYTVFSPETMYFIYTIITIEVCHQTVQEANQTSRIVTSSVVNFESLPDFELLSLSLQPVSFELFHLYSVDRKIYFNIIAGVVTILSFSLQIRDVVEDFFHQQENHDVTVANSSLNLTDY